MAGQCSKCGLLGSFRHGENCLECDHPEVQRDLTSITMRVLTADGPWGQGGNGGGLTKSAAQGAVNGAET
eukprot:CAMPEP_0175850386 /NCGR_PEP_ID=MMETSP0107_2-20121207/25063_1 /TAXON_ID=195067 ORGANISM="Goniomonas pacifica, Strain CCMP1869" /NCGR_SAMPLE_ID=MMETSP0107_2 /ASSEMBLY_ACC=CAM_ASM_000203 /LENGTH=69 /DNA_ID=CAMNT_0017165673 /DNA_START=147 /DNA_END=356 /DNA_ORIENTATION=-